MPFVEYIGADEFTSHKVPATTNIYGINRGERLVLNSIADMMYFLGKMRRNQGWKVVFDQKRWKESNYQAMRHNVAELVNIAKKEGVKRFDDKNMPEKILNETPVVETTEPDVDDDEEDVVEKPTKRTRKKSGAD